MEARSDQLMSLVDDEDIDGVLALVTPDEIAAAWWRSTSWPRDVDREEHPSADG
jgi:hypothetical protein